MDTLEKKLKKQNKLFQDIKNNLETKDYNELYIIYKYYKDLWNIPEEDRYLQEIFDKYTINYKNSNLLIFGILKIIKKIIDEKIIDEKLDYNNYPDYNNPDFIYEISNKLEFFHMKSLLNITDLSEKCNLRDPKKNDFQFYHQKKKKI